MDAITPKHSFERDTMESMYKTVSDIMIVEPDDLYHSKSKDFLSSHALLDFIDSPILYHQKRLGIIPAFDSAAFSLGRGCHTMILEGEEVFAERYAVGGPINPATEKPYGILTNKYKEWAAEQVKPVLSFDDLAKIKNMYGGFLQNGEAAKLISDGRAEGVIRTMLCGFNCQIRVDWLNIYNGIVDLKTTRSLDTFIEDAKDFSYLKQLAFYHEVIFQATGLMLPVHMVAVEKKAPFRCGVWQIKPKEINNATIELRQSMAMLRASMVNDHWPTGFESIRQAKLLKRR